MAESERFAIGLDAVRALDRAAAKGILHRRNAARRKARLMRQLAKLVVRPTAASASVSKGKKGAAAAPASMAPSSVGKASAPKKSTGSK